MLCRTTVRSTVAVFGDINAHGDCRLKGKTSSPGTNPQVRQALADAPELKKLSL
jgi:hypothetical protein